MRKGCSMLFVSNLQQKNHLFQVIRPFVILFQEIISNCIELFLQKLSADKSIFFKFTIMNSKKTNNQF
jgi:hypothetical protein